MSKIYLPHATILEITRTNATFRSDSNTFKTTVGEAIKPAPCGDDFATQGGTMRVDAYTQLPSGQMIGVERDNKGCFYNSDNIVEEYVCRKCSKHGLEGSAGAFSKAGQYHPYPICDECSDK